MTRCQVCEADARGAFLCKPCTRQLEQAIAELPADLADLQAVATRQAAGPLGLGHGRQWDGPPADGALGDAPWDYAPGAADQLWAAGNTLSTWIRHLCETRKVDPPQAARGTWTTRRELTVARNRWAWRVTPVFTPSPEQPVGPLCTWLLDNLDAIRYDEAAGQIHDEITGLHEENRRWAIGKAGTEDYYGLCDATQVGFELGDDGQLVPVAATCGADLYATEGEQRVKCGACGTPYTLAQRRLALRVELADSIGTIREVVAALLHVGRYVSAEGINSAIRRGRVPVRGVNGHGHRIVRVGDVESYLFEAAAKPAKRPKITTA